MPGWGRVSYVFDSPASGTPPFVTGMWFLAPAGADSEEFHGLLTIVRDAFNDDLDAALNSTLGTGVVEGQYIDETSVLDDFVGTLTPAGGGQVRNPGFSFRVVLQGSRPPGGRPNQMYFPFADTTYYGNDGTIGGGAPNATTIFDTWADNLLAAVEPTQFQWRNRHFVGADDASSSSVTGAQLAPTISFLRKRYR